MLQPSAVTVSIVKMAIIGIIVIFAIAIIITAAIVSNPSFYSRYTQSQAQLPNITVIENITTLVNKSEFIVAGTAVGVTGTSTVNGLAQTTYLFNVTENIKGSLPLDKFITITQTNGYANQSSSVYPDPAPIAGYGYILFLQNTTNTLSTVGGPQGRFVVYITSGNTYVASLNYYYKQDSWIALQYDGMPLNQFISVIRAVGG